MAKDSEKGSSKLGFGGIGDSTPSASPTPNKGQGGFDRQNLDFRGIADSTPDCSGESDKIRIGK